MTPDEVMNTNGQDTPSGEGQLAAAPEVATPEAGEGSENTSTPEGGENTDL